MEDQQQLAGCPFCGAAPVESQQGIGDDGYYAVECPDCRGACNTPFIGVHGDERASCVEAWNRRASPSSSVLERAREALLGLVEMAEDFWPNRAISRKGRDALAEIDRALGGGNAEL